jgi:exodeoxyribonuclease VII large subunit
MCIETTVSLWLCTGEFSGGTHRKLNITMADEIPSLADLRRSRGKRASKPRSAVPSAAPSLFDMSTEAEVSVADVLAEQARSLNASPVAANPLAPKTTPIKAADEAPRVWSVGDLVRQVRGLVERTYAQVTVEGEISNWRPAASGHCYFTLKDGDAQLSIVMFRRQAALVRFKPKDGDAVRLRGSLSIYESRGQMQMVAESMEQVGLGAMLAAVRELKERLKREGLFERKRPLPAFPRCIGVVTSVHGAALRDIVKVCRRRHAAVNLLVYSAAVQGPNCAAEVTAGLKWFSAHPGQADVVIVARGGGSWEDLHGFDDERVVRAIAACAVPVITGIGHATDTTIADAAADVCAPTPSAAAELVTAAQHGIAERVARLNSRLLRACSYELLHAQQRLSRLSAEVVLRRVRDGFGQREQRLDELAYRAENSVSRSMRVRGDRLARLEVRLRRQHVSLRLGGDRRKLETLRMRLESSRGVIFSDKRRRVERATSRLDALSPLRVLERGYALVYGPDGRLLRSAAGVGEGTKIVAQLAEGRLRARVTLEK